MFGGKIHQIIERVFLEEVLPDIENQTIVNIDTIRTSIEVTA